MAPSIPAMPTPPTPDAGAGKHGSQPFYGRGDDFLFWNFALTAQMAADAAGIVHAADGMRHYLNNSGEDFSINPDQAMNDVPGLKRHADLLVFNEIRKIAENPANHHTAVAFTTNPWEGHSISQAESQDWFLAMASVEVCATGVVTTTPADSGDPRVDLNYQVHLYDRYNWDGGKFVNLLGVTITDERMGALHTAGLAKEFHQFGTSSLKHFEGVLPAYGPVDLPEPDDSRTGTRTDPTR